jgi:hypothetical protein
MVNDQLRTKSDDKLEEALRRRFGFRSKKYPVPVEFVEGKTSIEVATVRGKTTIVAGIPAVIEDYFLA